MFLRFAFTNRLCAKAGGSLKTLHIADILQVIAKGREGGRKVRERKGEEGRGTEGKTVSSFLIRANFCAFCQTGITKTLTIV